MPRHGVSENGIGCKGNEKSDYLYRFRGLFFMVAANFLVLRHTRINKQVPLSVFKNQNTRKGTYLYTQANCNSLAAFFISCKISYSRSAEGFFVPFTYCVIKPWLIPKRFPIATAFSSG